MAETSEKSAGETNTDRVYKPGPWFATTWDSVVDGRGWIVANLSTEWSTEEVETHKTLIAAAPETKAQRDELLAACERSLIVFRDRGEPWCDHCIRILSTAIAQATEAAP